MLRPDDDSATGRSTSGHSLARGPGPSMLRAWTEGAPRSPASLAQLVDAARLDPAVTDVTAPADVAADVAADSVAVCDDAPSDAAEVYVADTACAAPDGGALDPAAAGADFIDDGEVDDDAFEDDADDDARERIVERFCELADQALTEESPPAGLAPAILGEIEAAEAGEGVPDGCDLYSMWSALTALTQEVKLEGRAFSQLRETLSALPELEETVRDAAELQREAVDAALETAGEARRIAGELLAEREREAVRRARRELVEGLLDARDGLVRALASARGHLGDTRRTLDRSSWLARRCLRGAAGLLEAARAVEKGVVMSVARLEDLLASFGVEEVEADGAPFDPERMRAADVETSATVPEGTVLEVYRAGYEWDGEILRPSEVKVARRPAETD
jgi:molecular chaperone GrpE